MTVIQSPPSPAEIALLRLRYTHRSLRSQTFVKVEFLISVVHSPAFVVGTLFFFRNRVVCVGLGSVTVRGVIKVLAFEIACEENRIEISVNSPA